MRPEILEEVPWLVQTFYTRSRITFYKTFHVHYYSSNRLQSSYAIGL